ncbi:MAG: alpha/beta fold hydrolase [Nitriliruptoraceae bacterium]
MSPRTRPATQVPRARVQRTLDWSFPPAPVRRELLEALPAHPVEERPPLLFVHGAWHGAWCWQEHWLPAAAAAGWHAVAVSLRGHGASERPARFDLTTLRHYEHDVLQAITALPAPPVLIGHSMGGLVVQRVLERYRAAPAGVLLASLPPDHGLHLVATLLRHDPTLLLTSLAGRSVNPRPGTLFGPTMPAEDAARVLAQLGPESWLALQQLVLPRRIPDVRTPMLVLGGEHDLLAPPHAVIRTARHYGTRAHLFRGMGHELHLEPGRDAVLDHVLAWIAATLEPRGVPADR